MTISALVPAGVLFAVGGLGLVTQVVVLREIMAAFAGNEFSAGVVVAVWIVCEALGAWLFRRLKARRWLPGTVLVSILSSAVAVPAVTLGRSVLRLVPAETVSVPGLAAVAGAVVLLPAFTHGGLFTLGASWLSLASTRLAPGRAYLWEGAGAVLAAGLLSCWLISRLAALTTVLVFALPVALALSLLPGPSWRARLGAAMLTGLLLVLAIGPADQIERWAWSRHWPGQQVKRVVNTHYGKVVRLQRENQQMVFCDGVPVLTMPPADPGRTEELIHLPLLASPRPERVLLLGPVLGGGILAALQEPVTEVVTVQLDPLLIEELIAAGGAVVAQELGDPRTRLVIADPRRFLAQTRDSFDCIILTEAGPNSLSANRLFTRQFFELCRRRLRPGGILATTTAGNIERLSTDARVLLALRAATLSQVFSHQEIVAADRPIILAGNRPLAVVAETLATRFKGRGLSCQVLSPDYLRRLLDPFRQRMLWAGITTGPPVRNAGCEMPNSDLVPTELFWNMVRENRLSAAGVATLYEELARHSSWGLAAVAILLVVGLIGGRSRGRRFGAGFTILTSGYAGAAISTLVLFSYQMRFGSVYSQVALLFAAFMLGTVLGSGVGLRLCPGTGTLQLCRKRDWAGIIFGCADFLLAAGAGLIPGLSRWGSAAGFVVTSGLAGMCLGVQFPIAAALAPENGIEERCSSGTPGRTAGRLFALDLVGGFGGSLLTALVLVPVLGVTAAALTVVAVKTASLLGQLSARIRLARPAPI